MVHTLVLLLEILVAIILFGIIIFVHELGHFLIAKLVGVKVNEFSLGMGPKIIQFQKGETKYSWRWLPIGGYCAMEGEDDDSKDPNAFSSKSIFSRIAVVIAGVIMNFLLGFVILLIAVGFCTQPEKGENETFFSSTKLSSINEESPAYKDGLRKDDVIKSINGKLIMTDLDLIYLLQSDEDGIFDIQVKRNIEGKNSKVNLNDVHFEIKKGEDDTRYLSYNFSVYPIKKNVFTVITRSAKLEYSYTVLIWRSLGSILSGEYGLNEMAGPVGTTDVIVDAVDDAVTGAVKENNLEGLYALLMLVVLITVNVGIFNILPLPALDGGRLVFLLIELIIGKPVPAKYESAVHIIGFLLLILLSVVIAYNDIVRIIQN